MGIFILNIELLWITSRYTIKRILRSPEEPKCQLSALAAGRFQRSRSLKPFTTPFQMENNIDLLMRPAITETKKSVVKESKKHSKMEKLKERNSL